ncbi:N-carbamoyl-L-amino acid hydrolase [Polaromonas vacuolata]|uniref:N-carbamoyl-L-amino acid hydrolase n=1 Tax=Polaromonas vacuolata TaxID=37448 RepID=A0A6H2H6G4_9BURK|nr:2-oxo-4-hydroxy-4-carboxy-5-ureidoimidazoline decarboxylase [Polaromonas vacuolata]QJC55445.1 N-carbamoyl-L-amino acid hydrolase [Polaromonas vacuolata]
MNISLEQINNASPDQAHELLAGLYEHSPWIAEQALKARPFKSLSALKLAMTAVLRQASHAEKMALIKAHPLLADKAAQVLSTESSSEQYSAGLTQCTPQELAQLQQLNADYQERFSFPFILAVRGPRGSGQSKEKIIATFKRRVQNHPDFEFEENLRNIHRIVELRLNDKFGMQPNLGNNVWDWHEAMSQYSDPGYAEQGLLTVTYLTDAHRACTNFIATTMNDCGFDSVNIDAVGNVVGLYLGADESAPRLLTGSHYDTVRNGGKYDGRLGIFVPMACVRQLSLAGVRLPFGIEVVGFAEEEGQRYKATFLGSGALTGDFKPEWLEQKDSDGISMHQAMQQAGLKSEEIVAIQRDAKNYLGFVEVHVEQGPVLNALDLPLGIVTSINGQVRYLCEITGLASHAGTTPMASRRDAAAASAEVLLYVEKRAAENLGCVATIGMLTVPNGSINVVPGRCQFSLDLRAPIDAQRDALENDVLAELKAICARRGLQYTFEMTVKVDAAPSAPDWQQRWENAVTAIGVTPYAMNSGAGHDAMKLHKIMPQAMLFVRGENAGISHNPLESSTSDDIQLAIEAFSNLIHQTAQDRS